jgi:hypothetical protein
MQAGVKAGVVFSEEFMAAAIRQHGPGAAAQLQKIQIEQSIAYASNYKGEPLQEQDYYDKNGVCLTDPPLRED